MIKALERSQSIASLKLLVLLMGSFAVRGDEVDDFIAAQMTWLHIPGLSLAVVKDGAIAKAKGYGLANLETDTPATPETVYKIGSLSKQFLATAILVLVQDGKLGLDDPAAKYLEGTPEAWKPITIRQLLTHTSGLIRELPNFDPFKPQSDADALKSAGALPLRFPPGEKWEYSNVGYYALAEIIRTVSGKPWSEFVAERVFAPADMIATRTTTSTLVPHRASGYSSRGRILLNAPDWPIVRPSGAFISTVLDLAKWDAALSANKILTPASRTALWTPVTLSNGEPHPYGFGWFVDSVNGHRRIRHDGGLPGFVSDFERFEDDKLTVIVLANRENRDLRDITLGVAGFYVPALRPAEEKPIADADPQTTALIKHILMGFVDGHPDAASFAPDLGKSLAAEMSAGMADTLRQLGAIQAFELLERKDDPGARYYRFRVRYRHVPLIVDCTFNAENKIAKFTLHD